MSAEESTTAIMLAAWSTWPGRTPEAYEAWCADMASKPGSGPFSMKVAGFATELAVMNASEPRPTDLTPALERALSNLRSLRPGERSYDKYEGQIATHAVLMQRLVDLGFAREVKHRDGCRSFVAVTADARAVLIAAALNPAEMREFAAFVEAWATANYERGRNGYNWQRGSADRWQKLAAFAAVAGIPAQAPRLRLQARCVVRASRTPKIKGVLRAGYRSLAWMLFRAARWTDGN